MMRKSAVNPMKKSGFQGGAKLFGKALQGIKSNDRPVRKSTPSQEKDFKLEGSMQTNLLSKPRETWCKDLPSINDLLLSPKDCSPLSGSKSSSEISTDYIDEPVISSPIPRCLPLTEPIDNREHFIASPTPSCSSGYLSSFESIGDGEVPVIISPPVPRNSSPTDIGKYLFMSSTTNSAYTLPIQTAVDNGVETAKIPKCLPSTETLIDSVQESICSPSYCSGYFPSPGVLTIKENSIKSEKIEHEGYFVRNKENVAPVKPTLMKQRGESQISGSISSFALKDASNIVTSESVFNPNTCGDFKPTFIQGSSEYTFDWSSKKSLKPSKELSDKRYKAKLPPSIEHLLAFSAESFIDSHCHLDLLLEKENFQGNYADYMRKNQQQFPLSYGGCVAVFCKPFLFRKVYAWKKHLTGENVWASFGCHPKNALSYNDLVERDLLNALKHPKVRALGEIGLDYSDRSMCPTDKQKDVLRRQLKIALKKQLPLVIHCRNAYEDCLSILKEELPEDYPIHLHCFTDKWQIAEEYLRNFSNMCIGITNLVTFSSATEVHEVARKIPLNRLLLETDAPFFVPTALSKEATVAHPGMAIFVAEKIASLKSVPLKEVLYHTRKNTQRIYQI